MGLVQVDQNNKNGTLEFPDHGLKVSGNSEIVHGGILINITNLKFNIIRAAWSLAADATTAKACDSEYNLSASIHHLNLWIATPALTVARKR